MSVNREEIIEQLERIRKYINDPNLSFADSQRTSLNESVDKCVRYAKYGRYHVTALGVFSTGKSTLLNAMLEEKILPAADLPVTAITTEVYYSDKTSFFIPMETVSEEVLADVRNGVATLDNQTNVEIVNSMQRDGESVAGVGGILETHSSKLIYNIITELTSQQKRNQSPFVELKKVLDSNHNLTLWLGVSTLPNWLRDIVLTDAPGTGSIDDSHEIIINKVIPESQLVLYLIESAKAGSAIDKRFCDRVSNTYHRKVFYVLNKIDQQNDDERKDALDCAKRCVPDISPDGEKPEFLCAAGLYALFAHEVAAGNVSVEDVLNDRKINLTRLLNKEWWSSDESGKKNLLVEFLSRNSKFDSLRRRIEEYLKYENKDIAIVQQSNAVIASVAASIVHVCDNTLRVLNSDKTLDDLEKKKEDAHDLRCKYAREADTTIRDYECSALDHNTGLGAAITGLLSTVPNEIASRLEEKLKAPSCFKKFKDKESLQKWLTGELQYCIEDVVRKINSDLNKRYSHLLVQLSPILKEIEEGTLANSLADVEAKDEFSTGVMDASLVAGGAALAGAAVAGGGAGLIAALGIGSTTAMVATPAAGVAGTLTGWGLNSLGAWAAGMGWGSLATTATTTVPLWGLSAACFFIPVVSVGAIAATIIALICFSKNRQIKTIVSKTKELLEKIVLTGGTIDDKEIVPVDRKMRESIEKTIRTSAEKISDGIETRLQQMEEEEQKLLEEFNKEKDIKKKKFDKVSQLKTEIVQVRVDAQKRMKKDM